MLKLPKFKANAYWGTAYQLLVAFVLLYASRGLFYGLNSDLYRVTSGEWASILRGGVVFDLATVCYLNLIVVLMRVLPFGFVTTTVYQRITNILFCVLNSFGLAANLFDTIFVRFTNTRTQMVAIVDFMADDNAMGIALSHMGTYWWMVLIFAAVVALLCLLALRVKIVPLPNMPLKRLVAVRVVAILIASTLMVYCIRGGFYNGRPLAVGDAVRYTHTGTNTPIVLNTPYTFLRNIDETSNRVERLTYMPVEQAEQLINAHKHYVGAQPMVNTPNVFIIILEGIGASFYRTFDYQQTDTTGGDRVMSFVDSLCAHSYVCTNAYSTGRRSIEGINAIMGGFPSLSPFVYMQSNYVANRIDGLARLLNDKGYTTTFYFGCNPGSYTIEQFAINTGYRNFIGRNEYGSADYDGTWGVYDHAMAQRIVDDHKQARSPMLTAWFTLTSHGPYVLPEQFVNNGYKPETMEWTVKYVDDVLRDMFAQLRQQPWFDSTLFVITSDHGSLVPKAIYNGPNNLYRVPLIFYTPNGSLAPQVDDRAASHIDITPSILALLGYDQPFIALGQNIFDQSATPHHAIFFADGLYSIVRDQHLLRFSTATPEGQVVGLYNKAADPDLLCNLLEQSQVSDSIALLANQMELYVRAFVQDYTHRINDNRLGLER